MKKNKDSKPETKIKNAGKIWKNQKEKESKEERKKGRKKERRKGRKKEMKEEWDEHVHIYKHFDHQYGRMKY